MKYSKELIFFCIVNIIKAEIIGIKEIKMILLWMEICRLGGENT